LERDGQFLLRLERQPGGGSGPNGLGSSGVAERFLVKIWRVILAALVIFAAGVVTGGLTIRLKLQQPAPPATPTSFGPLRQRGELLDRMQRQLYLTADQREHIEKILRDSHEHMRQLWDSIAPQAQEERRRVHDQIRAELTPDQQKQFDAMPPMSRGSGRFTNDHRRSEDWRDRSHKPGTNPGQAPAAPPEPVGKAKTSEQ
jgi:hypothetical protein